MYQVLAATSSTLRQMLTDAMAADVAPGGLATFFGGAGKVSLLSPREMQDSTVDGLSVWLYAIERDAMRLNDPPRTRVLPNGRVELLPDPLPLRLHYLLTPLATDSPDTEQRILGLAMQVLHTHSIVTGALLRGELSGTDAELHVHLESLGLDQIARVWEALDGSYQLSVSYEVSLARIELTTDPQRFGPVESIRTDATLMVGAVS